MYGCQFLLTAGADRRSQRPGMAALGQPRYASQRRQNGPARDPSRSLARDTRTKWPSTTRAWSAPPTSCARSGSPCWPGYRCAAASRPTARSSRGWPSVRGRVRVPAALHDPPTAQVNCPQPTGCSTGISSVPQATGHIGDWVLGMNGYGLILSLPTSSGPSSSPRPASSSPSPPPRSAPQSAAAPGAPASRRRRHVMPVHSQRLATSPARPARLAAMAPHRTAQINSLCTAAANRAPSHPGVPNGGSVCVLRDLQCHSA